MVSHRQGWHNHFSPPPTFSPPSLLPLIAADRLTAAMADEPDTDLCRLALNPDYTYNWSDRGEKFPVAVSHQAKALAPFAGICLLLAFVLDGGADGFDFHAGADGGAGVSSTEEADPTETNGGHLIHLAKWRRLYRVLAPHCGLGAGTMKGHHKDAASSNDHGGPESWDLARDVCFHGIARARGFCGAERVGRYFAVISAVASW